MRRSISLLILLTFFLPLAAWAASDSLAGKVLWIYDGDTIKVETVGKVRLLGIDAPERKDSGRDNYYLQQGIDRSRLRQIADTSLRYLITSVKNRHVTLRTDHETYDRYGRLLAYVYLPDGRLLNQLLVEKGYAAVYRKFDFRLKRQFLAAEHEARAARVGLWRK